MLNSGRFRKLSIAFLCFLFLAAHAYAGKVTSIDSIGARYMNGYKKLSIDVFNKFDWDVTITSKNGEIRHITTDKLDTVDFSNLTKAEFSTLLTVGNELRHKIVVLNYKVNGSVKILLNERLLLATGVFYKEAENGSSRLMNEKEEDFVFTDSLEKMQIAYIPRPEEGVLNLHLSINDYQWDKVRKSDDAQSTNRNYGFGFFYLAFGIVFIILFLFFRERTENLYFSLFCLTVAFAWLAGTTDNEFLSTLSVFLIAISMELFSIFLAKVLRNKNRSKIPLLIIIIITIISFHPAIRFHYSVIISSSSPVPVYLGIIYGVVLSYTGFSVLYYLLQGFGQKRWEAKTMFVISSVAFMLHLVIPFVLSIIFAFRKMTDELEYVVYVSDLGICLYPFSAAVVLGRRNGLNQKKLQNQVKSIERLSAQNLEKEREKKEILENQNVELEIKVNERTQEVLSQKQVIELKNKAITDNLTYAQRIQSAILPDVKLIYKTLVNAFILFRPKDIVSGDFYTFIEKDNKVLIIAGDCTGHGVSGAFMSMIGCSLLNQIISEKGITEPALVLNHLNRSIIETLKQTENESNDGMDLAICSFDLANYELQFAGANRPLWLVRNNEVIVIKPDKFPIGGLQVSGNRIFSNHNIKLQKDDTIYIFTDGFADQFGGEQGKKLMTSRFKDILISIQFLTMQEQEAFLVDYLKKWKNDHDQVDDILVIGVRV